MFEEAVSLLSIWASMNSWLTPAVLFLLLNLMIGTIAVTSGFAISHKPPHHHHHPHHHDLHLHHHQTHLTHSPSVLQRLKSLNFYSHIHSPQQHLHQQPFELHQQPPPPVVDGFPLPPTTISTADLTRSPSVLQRLKSLDFFSYIHSPQQPPPPPVRNEFSLPPTADPIPETETDLSPEDEAATEVVVDDDEGPTLDEVYNLIVQKGNSAHYGRQNSDTEPIGGEVPVPLPRRIKKFASDKSAFNHFEAVPEFTFDNASAEMVVEERETAAAKAAVGGSADVGVDERADDFINMFRQQLKMQRIDSIVR